MSDDPHNMSADHRPPSDTMVPLVDKPGQLYPPARDPSQDHRSSNQDLRSHQSRDYRSSNQDLRSAERSSSYRVNDAPIAAPVVVSQPNAVVPGNAARYRYEPLTVTCQHCGATVITSVEDVRGKLQYMLCCLMCCYGCWLGCCVLPFFVNDLKDVEHKCPGCGRLVGKFEHVTFRC